MAKNTGVAWCRERNNRACYPRIDGGVCRSRRIHGFDYKTQIAIAQETARSGPPSAFFAHATASNAVDGSAPISVR